MKPEIPAQVRVQIAGRIRLNSAAAYSVWCALTMVEVSGAPGLYIGGDEHIRLLRDAVLTLSAESGPSEELCALSRLLVQAVGDTPAAAKAAAK